MTGHPRSYDILMVSDITIIDSLDGLTFQNQLMDILLVMLTGQHLNAIPKNDKIRLCILSRAWLKIGDFKYGNHLLNVEMHL